MLQICSFHVGGVTHDEFDSSEEGQLQLVVLVWTREKITNLSSHVEIYFTETFKVFESCGQILFSRASVKNLVQSAISPTFLWYAVCASLTNLN